MALRTSKVRGMNWYYSSGLGNVGRIDEYASYQVVPDNLEPRHSFTQSGSLLQHVVATSETCRAPFSFDMRELSREVNDSSGFPRVRCDSAGPPERTGLLGDVLGQVDRRGAMSSADDIFLNTEMISTSQSSPFEYSAGGSSTEAGSSETTSVTMLGYGLNECSSSREVPEEGFMIPDEIDVFRHDTGHVNEEEMVVQDLESVITQMTKDTRICFRNAFYHLAKRSRNMREFAMDPPSVSFSTHETLRYGGAGYMEAENYEIDRAIADLMFDDQKHEQLDMFSIESARF